MTRVVAFVNLELTPKGKLHLYMIGRGTVEGFFNYGDEKSVIPADTVEARANLLLKYGMFPDLRIRLDTGDIIWASSVFYEEEDKFDEFLPKIDEITQVDLEEFKQVAALERSIQEAISSQLFSEEEFDQVDKLDVDADPNDLN